MLNDQSQNNKKWMTYCYECNIAILTGVLPISISESDSEASPSTTCTTFDIISQLNTANKEEILKTWNLNSP